MSPEEAKWENTRFSQTKTVIKIGVITRTLTILYLDITQQIH